MMTLLEKLVKIFVDGGYELGPSINWKLKRVYAGHHQRSAGAWSWYLHYIGEGQPPTGIHEFGSQYPAKLCASHPSPSLYLNPWSQVAIDID